ncbi:MAG: hypothetical protein M3Z84_10510 [Actinomycetota bacterium]|nr:hypothetical protein [Actinomycetota bacterium]
MENLPDSDHDLERIRRSVAMLAPSHPGGLNRETALQLLAELQRLKQRDRRVVELGER